MASDDRPSRAFDLFRLSGSIRRPASPTNSDDSAGKSEVDSVAQYLRRLGYPQGRIKQILDGPASTSVEAVSGRIVGARSVEAPRVPSPTSGSPEPSIAPTDSGDEPTAEAPDEGRPPPGDSPASAEAPDEGRPPAGASPGIVPPAPKKYPARVKVSDFRLDVDQKDIVDAVWRSLHGSPGKLAVIADNFEKLTGPLQAYVSASVEAGKLFLVSLEQWVADFNRAQAKKAKERAEDAKKQKEIVGSVTTVAAAAANSIPVVGQAISLLIVAAVAIGEAIADAFPLPLREGADQVIDAHEGIDVFLGITEDFDNGQEPPLRQDRLLATKQAVVQDAVAFLLPVPPYRADYKFTPTIEQFRRAAHELALYEGEENSVVNE